MELAPTAGQEAWTRLTGAHRSLALRPPALQSSTQLHEGGAPMFAGDHGAAAVATSGAVRGTPWRMLLSRKEVWAIIICHFAHNCERVQRGLWAAS